MEHVAASTSFRITDTDGTRDYTSEFKTNKKFKSKEELIDWAREIGRSHGFVIITLKSDSGKGSKKPRLILACERSGKCDGRRINVYKAQRQHTGTKKCNCPFRLKGKKLAAGDEWELLVVKGMHNHDAGHPGQGHSFQGRLSNEEKSLLKEMCKTEEKPRQVLRALKMKNKQSKSTIRTIYNEFQSMKRRQRLENEDFQLQQFMSKAEGYDFIEKHRTSPKMDTVMEFFVTHPTSLDMLLAFPTVLKFEIRHRVPERMTLDIFGVTSTDVNFYVGMAILGSKRIISSYEWALTSLRGVINDYGIVMPDIVFFEIFALDEIQMAKAAVKVIKDVFSTAKLSLFPFNFAFYWRANTRGLSELNRVEHDSFVKKWRILVESPSKDDFEQHVMQLRNDYPEAVEFVIANVLKPYKEMFVRAWTDQLMHFGNTDPTNEIPKSHFVVLENLDGSSEVVEQTVIDESWKDMQRFIGEDHALIKASFEESLKYEYKDKDWHPELKELPGAISKHAFELIRNETMISSVIGDHEYCNCTIRSTHGLPCAHEIAEYKRQGRPVPLECIHSYWKKLDLKPLRKTGEPNVEQSEKRRRRLSEQNSVSLPDTEESEPNSPNAGPSIVPSTQEKLPNDNEVCSIPASKQFEFSDVCPLQLRPYILQVKDVARDGHCGFRAIASFVGYSEEDGWVKVREDLTSELLLNSFHYAQLFGSDERVNELFEALAYIESICLQKKHWMTMPDMGHIIASTYNIVLVNLSSSQCNTFFPLRTAPISISISSPREIVIGFVQDHVVQVYLKKGHPMPPTVPAPAKKNPHVATIWERYHEQRLTEWLTAYSDRIGHFKSLQPEVMSQKNPITLYVDISLPSLLQQNTDY